MLVYSMSKCIAVSVNTIPLVAYTHSQAARPQLFAFAGPFETAAFDPCSSRHPLESDRYSTPRPSLPAPCRCSRPKGDPSGHRGSTNSAPSVIHTVRSPVGTGWVAHRSILSPGGGGWRLPGDAWAGAWPPHRQSGDPPMARDLADMRVPLDRRDIIRAGALVAINTSRGKDSQAMTILLSRIGPDDRLAAVHAPLREVEWPATVRHVEARQSPTIRAGTVADWQESPRGGAISRIFRSSAFAWTTSRRSSSPYSR